MERSALDAAHDLLAALGMLPRGHGEVTVQVIDGEIRVVRHLRTITREMLRALPVPEAPP